MLKRFKKLYSENVKETLTEKFKYTNVHQVPKLAKIVINMGVTDAVSDSKVVDKAANELSQIAGQKAIVTKASKSIAGFKLREGMKLGCKVTLRGDKAYEFLERLVIIVLPRVKDFRGFSSKSFDGKGNFSFGLKDQVIFPEIKYDQVDRQRGMDITIVTSANSNAEGKSLLEAFSIPFYN